MNHPVSVKQYQQALYAINGVEYVTVDCDVVDPTKLAHITVGVDGGRFEAVCNWVQDADELIEIVEIYCTRAIDNKRRHVSVKFVSDNY